MPRMTLQPPELFASTEWGFSQVVVSPPGTIVHIAGQVPWDNQGNAVHPDSLEKQLDQVLKNIVVAVEAAGGSPDHLQMLRIYIVNFKPGEDANLVARCLSAVFGNENPPASSWIGVVGLAQPEYLVEADAVAVIPA